jgi:hypothetical protein
MQENWLLTFLSWGVVWNEFPADGKVVWIGPPESSHNGRQNVTWHYVGQGLIIPYARVSEPLILITQPDLKSDSPSFIKFCVAGGIPTAFLTAPNFPCYPTHMENNHKVEYH